MKDGSEGDDETKSDVISARDADSSTILANGNGPVVAVTSHSQQRRMQVMGATLAALGAEVASSALASAGHSVHDGLSLVGNTTLANALLGITIERTSNNSNNNGRINSTSSPRSTGSSSNGKGDNVISSGGNGQNNNNRDKVFVCPICNRCFGYKHVLQNHERTHTGEKPFECKECHKRFTRDHHLKTHMRLHTGEKPYHCSHCDRQFVQVANLRRHLRVHTGERPYACTLCSSRFSDSNQLKAHLLIHEGVKPFECLKCHGRFRRRHHLVHHKCPKDEANIGKPRRGRRPKAYEQLASSTTIPLLSPVLQERLSAPITELKPHVTPVLPTMNSMPPTAALTSVITKNISPPQLQPPPRPHQQQQQQQQQPPIAHMHQQHQVRRNNHIHTALHILNPNGRYHDTMQSGPLDMSVTSGPTNNSVSVIVPRTGVIAHHPHYGGLPSSQMVDGVLDLSNSRSDSEAEPIEEEVDEADIEDDDDCLDDSIDLDSEDEGVGISIVSWREEAERRYHIRRTNLPDELSRRQLHNNYLSGKKGNGETAYDSDGDGGNMKALKLTTS